MSAIDTPDLLAPLGPRAAALLPYESAVDMAGALGIRPRLLTGVRRIESSIGLTLATVDPNAHLALANQRGRAAAVIDHRSESGPDEREFDVARTSRENLFLLELSLDERRVRVPVHGGAAAILHEHGWAACDADEADELLAEPVVEREVLTIALAQLLTSDFAGEAGSSRTAAERRVDASRALALLRRIHPPVEGEHR